MAGKVNFGKVRFKTAKPISLTRMMSGHINTVYERYDLKHTPFERFYGFPDQHYPL